MRIVRERNQLEFVRLRPADFDAVTFHDPTLQERLPVFGRMSFDEVHAHVLEHLGGLSPARYVFHHAFCCSTLLARLLGRPGIAFDYREPALFTELVQLSVDDPAFFAGEVGRKLLFSAIGLHRRTQLAGELALVKACDAVTGIVEPLLEIDADARGILLHSDLDPFAVACLESGVRREWLRHRARLVSSWRLPELAELDVDAMPDAEACGFVWAGHLLTFARLLRRFAPRLRPLAAEELVDQPIATVCAAAAFLELGGERLAEHVERFLMKKVHAKSGVPYDAETRRRKLEHARGHLSAELEQAHRWCAAHRLPIRASSFYSAD